MRSKLWAKKTTLKIISSFAFAGLILNITSCGLLGTKNRPAAAGGPVGTGCLNNSGDLLTRFANGTISRDEWNTSFDCINASLKFFTEYVHGANQDSYSQADMYTLVSRFLITNHNVDQGLMAGAFSLKAALFGGNTSEFTLGEVELVKDALTHLRDITGDLIPYMQLQNSANPSYADLEGLVAAFQSAGEQLSDYINTLPVGSLSSDAFNNLLAQVSKTFAINLIDGLGDKIFLGKWILLNTRPDAFESADWGQIFKTALGVAGIYYAYKSAVGSDPLAAQHQVITRLHEDYRFREFLWQLALSAKPYLQNALNQHHGNIPFPLWDHVIDQLPDSFLNPTIPAATAGNPTPTPDPFFNTPKSVFKNVLRPLFRKFFASQSQMGVDQQLGSTVSDLIENWVETTGMLDRIYESTGLDPVNATQAQMIAALNQYQGMLSTPQDQATFLKVKNNILTTANNKTDWRYKPLFNGTNRIYFDGAVQYSKYQAFITMSVEPLIQHLNATYGSGNGYFIETDFESIYADYRDLLFGLQMVNQNSKFPSARFQDIDIFTPASDGNQQDSIQEMTYWALMVIDSGALSTKMRAEITPLCDAGQGLDAMGWEWVNADCFRKQFGDRLEYWIPNFPHLAKYWATHLTLAQQHQAMIWLEHGARRDGYDESPFGHDDFGSMATILYYTETLFTRYDTNADDIMEQSEVLQAYPIFKNLLAKKVPATVANIGGDFLLQGVFSYIINYQELPDTTTGGGIQDFVYWLLIYWIPTTHYQTDRAGVFNIVCQLGVPDSAAQQAMSKTICTPTIGN